MCNRTATAVLFGIFVLVPYSAAASEMQGLGATSCAEFAQLYQMDPSSSENSYFDWAQGFMSGLNWGMHANKGRMRELAGVVANQQRDIRNYCADNPLKTYRHSVIELYKNLDFQP
jgi:hypothetical protein